MAMGTEGEYVLHHLMERPLLNQDKILQLLHDTQLINVQNKAGKTPLMVGIENDHKGLHADIMDICVDNANVGLKDNNGNTLLHYFCRYGLTQKIDVILTKMKEDKVDLWCLNRQKETPLHHVHKASLVQTLLKLYNDVGSRPEFKGKSELFTNIDDHVKNFGTFNYSEVISKFCDESLQYSIPTDMDKIIMFLITSAKKHKAAVLEILVVVLRFGQAHIDSTHVAKCMNTVDDWSIFDKLIANCPDPSAIAESAILKSVGNKKNSIHFFDTLNHRLKVNIGDLKDDLGRNFSHFVCKSGSIDFLSKLTDKMIPVSVVKRLLTTTDKENNYPVEYLRDDTAPAFLEELHKYAAEHRIDITRAKPTLDITHHALTKMKHPLFTRLLEAGFPVVENSQGETLLHLIAKRQIKQVDPVELCETVISHIRSESDYILKTTTNTGFTALDYTLFYYDKNQRELLEFLLDKGATVNTEVENKILHFLVRDDKVDKESLHYLSTKLGIEYPNEINTDFADDIKIAIRKLEQEVDTEEPLNQSESLKPLINVLAFKPLSRMNQDSESDGNLSARHSNEDRIVNFHSVPQDVFCLDHITLYGKLTNKRILIISPLQQDKKLHSLLSYLLQVHPEFIVTTPDFDSAGVSVLCNYAGLPSSFTPRPPQLLDITEITEELPDNLESDVDSLRAAGHIFQFTVDKVRYYTPSIFGVSTNHRQEILSKIRLLDVSYDGEGGRVYTNPTITTEQLGDSFNGVVKGSDGEGLNVSRYAVPFIISRLITSNMMIPSSDKNWLIMIDPDIFVSVSYQDDSVNISYNTFNNSSAEKKCFESYLKRTIGNMFAVNPKWKIEWGAVSTSNHVQSQVSQDYDIAEEETELLDDVESAAAVLGGDSLLLSCDIIRLSNGIASNKHTANLKQRYFSTYAPDCDLLVCDGNEKLLARRLLYRIIQKRGKYTIRQFVQDGKWGKNRKEICALIGIDVVQSYTKLQNLWRGSWVDFLVLLIGTILVLGIILGCNAAGVDLESYGVAGLTTLPFIVAVLRKVVRAYTVQSDEGFEKGKEGELPVE